MKVILKEEAMRKTIIFILFYCLFQFFLACSTNENDNSKEIAFDFESDLNGWETGTSGKQLDSVSWLDWGGQPPGCVKMDGSDFGTSDHQPNSWMYKEIALPGNITKMTFITSAHDRENANAELRVRLIDENQLSNILLDWELASNGVEGELVWIEKTVNISSFAGQTVTIFFEQGDNDIGVHEQRYIDKIRIF